MWSNRGRHMRALRTGAILLMLALPGPAIADQFSDGVTAYNRLDYTTALRFSRPLAERGNAAAQNNLGSAYENGRGVAKGAGVSQPGPSGPGRAVRLTVR